MQVPRYTVVAHRRVLKFLADLREEAVKERMKEVIRKLVKSKTGRPESLFGACAGSRSFVREKEDEHVI